MLYLFYCKGLEGVPCCVSSEFSFHVWLLHCFTGLHSSALFASELKPTQVPGHQAVRSGEHPRLLFRKSDLPEIKRRAKTPEGQAIVAQLKKALGGGEAMPEHVSTVRIPYHETANLPMGGFSISQPLVWHAVSADR